MGVIPPLQITWPKNPISEFKNSELSIWILKFDSCNHLNTFSMFIMCFCRDALKIIMSSTIQNVVHYPMDDCRAVFRAHWHPKEFLVSIRYILSCFVNIHGVHFYLLESTGQSEILAFSKEVQEAFWSLIGIKYLWSIFSFTFLRSYTRCKLASSFGYHFWSVRRRKNFINQF